MVFPSARLIDERCHIQEPVVSHLPSNAYGWLRGHARLRWLQGSLPTARAGTVKNLSRSQTTSRFAFRYGFSSGSVTSRRRDPHSLSAAYFSLAVMGMKADLPPGEASAERSLAGLAPAVAFDRRRLEVRPA